MSLNWNTQNCNPSEAKDDNEAAIREMIIWQTMVVHMGEITENNWKEFYARIALMEKITGPLMLVGGEPYPVTPEMVRRWIGLTTNVSTDSRAKFLREVIGSEIDYIIKRDCKE